MQLVSESGKTFHGWFPAILVCPNSFQTDGRETTRVALAANSNEFKPKEPYVMEKKSLSDMKLLQLFQNDNRRLFCLKKMFLLVS